MEPSHLSVVLDLCPSEWHSSSLPLDGFLAQLLVFLNAHIALEHDNSLAVFAALPNKSVILYASSDPSSLDSTVDPNCYPPFKRLDSAVIDRISAELADPSLDLAAPSALVGALTRALCYIQRLSLAARLVDPRILILSVSPDLSTAYIPIMNAIFSAQKLKITIDAGQILGPDTVFLQQAAHLTGGSYLYLTETSALLQYLIMSFLPPPAIRKLIAVPTQDKIDFRAACFCHKNIVDIGFVCSVCLSIFCQPVPVCSTCRTKFPIKTLQRLNASRPHNSPRSSPAGSVTPPVHPRSRQQHSTTTPSADSSSVHNGSL